MSDTNVLPKTGYTALTGTILKETEKAVLIELECEDGEVKDYWIPLSCISYIHCSPAMHEDVIHVEDWIITKRGIDA